MVLDTGECDYEAIVSFLAKKIGANEKKDKVEILCEMLRVGFKLEDTFDAGFDALDCDDADGETSRNEVCYDVRDAFEDDACVSASPLASSSDKSAGGGSTSIIIAVAVVVILGIAAAAFLVTRNKGSSAAKGGVTSFENPMYDTAFQTSGGGGGAPAGGSGQTSGYMDVAGQPSAAASGGPGYMDVAPEPATYDNMAAPAAESASSGYMDVAGGGSNYIDDDDEEDV